MRTWRNRTNSFSVKKIFFGNLVCSFVKSISIFDRIPVRINRETSICTILCHCFYRPAIECRIFSLFVTSKDRWANAKPYFLSFFLPLLRHYPFTHFYRIISTIIFFVALPSAELSTVNGQIKYYVDILIYILFYLNKEVL